MIDGKEINVSSTIDTTCTSTNVVDNDRKPNTDLGESTDYVVNYCD